MILLDFTYIHDSGGKTLLEEIYRKIKSKNILKKFLFLFDSRYDYCSLNIHSSQIYHIPNSEIHRYNFYKKRRNQINKVFCFGNIPPPINVDCEVYIYFHNILLLDLENSSLKTIEKFILLLKRFYLKILIKNKFFWFVQTSFIKKKLQVKLGVKEKNIFLHPIFKKIKVEKVKKKKKEFLYVTNYNRHKNIERLINAFIHASNRTSEKLILKLTLTKDQIPNWKNFNLNSSNLKIVFLGNLIKKELYKEYLETKFLIYPSLKESFGLPLIEATQFKCFILASNLEYANEVIEASIYFDPFSEKDIAEKVLYCLKNKNLSLPYLKISNSTDIILNKLLVN